MRHGHIKLSRKMFDGADMLWSESRKFSRAEAWIDLIQLAAWRDDTPYTTPHHGVDLLARGQFVASIRYLAVRWQWSKNTVSRFLDMLEKAGRLMGQEMGHHGRLYLIVNYDAYQGGAPDDGTPDGTEDGTEAGQVRDTRGTDAGQRRSSKAVKQEQPASRAADAAADDAGEPTKPARKPRAGRTKGEPAPWMGDVNRLWREQFGTEPPRGTATALAGVMREHGPDVVLSRLAVYARKTGARYINLNTFAGTLFAPEWTPDGVSAAPVLGVAGEAARLADVLVRADACGVDPVTAHQRLSLAVQAESVALEDAKKAWGLIKPAQAVISRNREAAVRQVEALLRVADREPQAVGAA